MSPDARSTEDFYIVGGVRLPRPFRVRRLGHFGIDVVDTTISRDFYTRYFGLKVSDVLDFKPRLPPEDQHTVGPTQGYFMRHGTDHHSFVIFPRKVRERIVPRYNVATSVNQITWQVGSLREVVDGFHWLNVHGVKIARSGRDNPGSNWHAYPVDPSGHTNEIYYGIEQIGWDGMSKPSGMHRRNYNEIPKIPHKSEYSEIEEGLASGVDFTGGTRGREELDETYDVGGVLLARPFKVTKIGPVRLFVENVNATLAFYCKNLGLTLTEETTVNGHRCCFLRANTEHHSLAIYPIGLRAELDLSSHTTLFSCGFQVADYQQLRDAVAFLEGHGVKIRKLPPELSPGIDYNAFAIDPDGNAIQLYYYMEQVGWDGRPRQTSQRPRVDNAEWPASVDGQSDTFLGEAYLGPWN